MSSSMNVFVGPGCTLDQVVECVERVLEHPLYKGTDERGVVFSGRALGVDVRAIEGHDTPDDGDLDFSRYRFRVSFEVAPGSSAGQLRDDLAHVLAMLTAHAVFHELKVECLAARGGSGRGRR